MNTYEAFVILKPILDVDNSDTVLKNLESLIESANGKISKKDKLGRKRLAYEIMNFKDGFFVTYQLALEPSKIAQIHHAVRLNEDILRFALVSRTEAELNEVNSPPSRDSGRDSGGRPGNMGDSRPRRDARA